MLYAHLGLSAVIYSSRDPGITALDSVGGGAEGVDDNTANNGMNGGDNSTVVAMCTNQDIELWTTSGGESQRPTQSNYCSRTYTSPTSNNFCLVTASCISQCFQSIYGYSESCSNCFAAIPTCSMRNLCTFACAADSFGEECRECNLPCVEELNLCSGLPEVEEAEAEAEAEGSVENTTTALPTSVATTSTITQENIDTCNRYDLSKINTWYTAYELTFIRSIHDAWTGQAKLLAIIIVLFSGIWT